MDMDEIKIIVVGAAFSKHGWGPLQPALYLEQCVVVAAPGGQPRPNDQSPVNF